MNAEDFKPGIYRHYGGGDYIALQLVRHHETDEKFVVYVSCSHNTVSIREYDTPSKDSWCDVVEYSTGCMGSAPIKAPRFKYVGPAP